MLHIDVPADRQLTHTASTIQGWYLAPRRSPPLHLEIGGVHLTSVRVERPDARRVFGPYVHGFMAVADLNALAHACPNLSTEGSLDLVSDGAVVATKPLHLPALNRESAVAAAAARASKREWLIEHFVCPSCKTRLQSTRCPQCGSAFVDDGKIFNFLPDEFKRIYQIGAWDDISAHGYDDVARDVIENVRRAGGKVLDCGSGMRSEVDETVICLEVDSFPNVDVLAVNQKLPFPDALFDAVLSLNVLEHVTDPFACAAELARVLKPGGTLYCCIPFLQPEHGYPSHYFNATRSGLQQLFLGKLDLVRHFVPGSGQPIWSLHWFLSWYLRELPDAHRKAFLNMRIEDLLAARPSDLLDANWVAHLSEAGKWCLASSTAALFTKPPNPGTVPSVHPLPPSSPLL